MYRNKLNFSEIASLRVTGYYDLKGRVHEFIFIFVKEKR